MSTLEKTIDLLNILPENQVETIYSFAQFLSMQYKRKEKAVGEESVDTILGNIVGSIPDTGKTAADYKAERIRERYGAAD